MSTSDSGNTTSTNDEFHLVYGTPARSKGDSREHRLRCLEVAAKIGSDAEHIVRAAKRYWHFVRKGE